MGVRTQAYLYSAMNTGSTIGAGIVALAAAAIGPAARVAERHLSEEPQSDSEPVTA